MPIGRPKKKEWNGDDLDELEGTLDKVVELINSLEARVESLEDFDQSGEVTEEDQVLRSLLISSLKDGLLQRKAAGDNGAGKKTDE